MRVELFETIRGVEVHVFADNFDGDPSVGICYGPEEVYARDMDGNPFELTDEEVERFGIKATTIYYESDGYD